jgi:hypothetical protein
MSMIDAPTIISPAERETSTMGRGTEVPSALMQKDSWCDHRTPEDGEDHADRFKRKAHLNLP